MDGAVPTSVPSPSRPSMRWLAVPATTALLGAGVVLWSMQEERNLQRGLEGVLRAHVESVAQLVSEGVRETTDTMDALSSLRESYLRSLASRHAAGDAAPEIALVARVDEVGGQLAVAEGTLGAAELQSLADRARAGETTIELAGAGATCVASNDPSRQSLWCWDDREFQALRRQTGLGALLKGLAGHGTAYVALQDESGLLASSPTPAPLSSSTLDPLLGQARAGGFRVRDAAGDPGTLVEALSPFTLPDGTVAVLRVGVDAEPIHSALGSASRRHRVLLLAVGALVLASLAAAILLRRRDARLAALERWGRLQEQQQLHWQEVGLLAAEVAHEVRNPLSTVKMVGQRLAREFEVPEKDRAEYAELVGLIDKEGARVEAVVGDFLDLARPLKLEPRPVDLRSFLLETTHPLRLRAAAEGKDLVFDVPEAACRVDGRRMYQVIANLVGNALDAVAEGGTVRLSAQAGDGVRICVRDDGPGMSPETLERVQRPFHTSKPRGTGLGLALTRRLVEAHGGTLTLESLPGRGTSACVWLPGPASRWTPS